MFRTLSNTVLILAAVAAIGCQQVDLAVRNRATTNKLNVFVTNPGESLVYGSVTKIQPGQFSKTTITLAAGPGAGSVASVRVIANLSTPGGAQVANVSQLVDVSPDSTSVIVTAEDDDSISIMAQ